MTPKSRNSLTQLTVKKSQAEKPLFPTFNCSESKQCFLIGQNSNLDSYSRTDMPRKRDFYTWLFFSHFTHFFVTELDLMMLRVVCLTCGLTGRYVATPKNPFYSGSTPSISPYRVQYIFLDSKLLINSFMNRFKLVHVPLGQSNMYCKVDPDQPGRNPMVLYTVGP